MNTYEIIRELSRQRKISIAELERTLGLSNGSISKWSKNSPNAKYLEKIADFFSVSVDYLLGRSNDKKKEKIEDFIKNAKEAKDIDKLDYEKQKVIVRNLISGIKVFNDKVEINWNI